MAHQNLWAPWRMSYLRSLVDGKPVQEPRGCFICDAANADPGSDTARGLLVLQRSEHGLLMMNRYPYSNGHIMAAPRKHVADISDLSAEERAGLMELADRGNRLLRKVLHCQGVNLGMNLGRCAGAGVPGHCHMHLVPRWNGDVNFMQTVAEARVIPQALEESYQMLLDGLDTIKT